MCFVKLEKLIQFYRFLPYSQMGVWHEDVLRLFCNHQELPKEMKF